MPNRDINVTVSLVDTGQYIPLHATEISSTGTAGIVNILGNRFSIFNI